MDYKSLIDSIINSLDTGFIHVGFDGKIYNINDRAKEITGIKNNYTTPHPAGNLDDGDIVIIADNKLGYDDGNLTVEDLRILGIDDRRCNLWDFTFKSVPKSLKKSSILKPARLFWIW